MTPFSALVVEDYEQFRRFLCLTLQEKTSCHALTEASDGLEAVEKAEHLRPDLILLDLGLSKLNGMEAARRIRKVSPNSRILFVSQNCSPEVVKGALQLGACGYLLKSDAAELPRAVDAILQGTQFVSSRLARALLSAGLIESVVS